MDITILEEFSSFFSMEALEVLNKPGQHKKNIPFNNFGYSFQYFFQVFFLFSFLMKSLSFSAIYKFLSPGTNTLLPIFLFLLWQGVHITSVCFKVIFPALIEYKNMK